MLTVDNWIQKLDIADGLKQLLVDAGVTRIIIGLDYQQVADMLYTDPYVGRLIVEALHNLIQGKKSNWANILPVLGYAMIV
jgi:hypothetical protein